MNQYYSLGKTAPIDLDPIWYNDNLGPLPPIYSDPVKYPVYPGDGPMYPDTEEFRNYDYQGIVRGAYTELPLPGATVALYSKGKLVAQQAANLNGEFFISLASPADTITISEVSHQTFTWPASEQNRLFDLIPNEKQIDPVVLPPGVKKKSNYWVWLLAGLVIAKSQKWI